MDPCARTNSMCYLLLFPQVIHKKTIQIQVPFMSRSKSNRNNKLSHQLSWLLRHGIGETTLVMDAAGWVLTESVLSYLKITEAELEEVVSSNNKTRYERNGDYLRASQGHSLQGTPVTREALEASWQEVTQNTPLWHGSQWDVAEQIVLEGIKAMDRTHVHLAEAIDSDVGKRANVTLLFKVDPQRLRTKGLKVFRSPNGVILVREVPPECLVSYCRVPTNNQTNIGKTLMIPEEPYPG
jgi:putative RNA 2'-phosphotransferase